MPQVREDKTLFCRWDSCDYYDEDAGNHENQENQDDAWDNMTEALTEWMQEHNPDGDWRAEVTGFGWQRQDGYKDFHAETGQKLLQDVLPNTECTFNVYDEGDHLSIENAHHDAPTGGEWYAIRPVLEDDDDS